MPDQAPDRRRGQAPDQAPDQTLDQTLEWMPGRLGRNRKPARRRREAKGFIFCRRAHSNARFIFRRRTNGLRGGTSSVIKAKRKNFRKAIRSAWFRVRRLS